MRMPYFLRPTTTAHPVPCLAGICRSLLAPPSLHPSISTQVHGRDLAALERGIEAVLHGDISMEDPVHMSTSNYIQLIRLCQLAVDYLEHEVAWLRNLAVALQEKHAALRG